MASVLRWAVRARLMVLAMCLGVVAFAAYVLDDPPVDALPEFIERAPVRVTGLMTMPPFSSDPEHSRPYFARLAELAAANGLSRLSMGTSQDWRVAIEEGATIVRLGHALFV